MSCFLVYDAKLCTFETLKKSEKLFVTKYVTKSDKKLSLKVTKNCTKK